MTIPRLIVLTIYPLLLLTASLAAYQTRRLAQAMPSQAWSVKLGVMIFFAGVQVYGFAQNVIYSRQASWSGAIYFGCTLIFMVGLNWFDYLLLQTNKNLRARISKMPISELSGDQSVDEWRKNGRDLVKEAIYESVKSEYLNPL